MRQNLQALIHDVVEIECFTVNSLMEQTFVSGDTDRYLEKLLFGRFGTE